MKTYEQFYINGEWVDPVEGKNMFDVLRFFSIHIADLLCIFKSCFDMSESFF